MNPSLVDIKGIGEATAQMLVDAGFPSVEDVANAEPGALTVVPGIGQVRASKLKADAARLVEEQVPAEPQDEPSPAAKLSKKARKKARDLKKTAKDLQQQAKDLAKKAKSTKSKKKRKRRLVKVADLEAAAKKARKKAKKLLSG